MAKISDKEAYNIHVLAYSDSDSDVDGKPEFDEEYKLLKPPPLELDEDQIVVIPSEDAPLNVWEERLKAREALNGGENEDISDDTSTESVKKKKRTRSKKKKKLEDKEEKVPVVAEISTGTKKSNLKNTPPKISYDAETLKKLKERVDNLDEKNVWHYGLDNSSVAEELNSIRTKEKDVLFCFKTATASQTTENKTKKKKKKQLTGETNEKSQQETVVSGEKQAMDASTAPLPTTPGDNHKRRSYLEEFQYIFGEDFKEFIQSMMSNGLTNVNDLNAFTYEQLYSAYKAYRQKKLQFPSTPVNTAYVRPTYYQGSPQNNVMYPYQSLGNAALHPPYQPTNFNTNMMLPQNNPNWCYFGNPNTNIGFFFNPVPNMNRLNVPPLQLTEIRDNNENRSNAAAARTKTKENKPPKPENIDGAKRNPAATETSNVPSIYSSNTSLESNVSKKTETKPNDVENNAIKPSTSVESINAKSKKKKNAKAPAEPIDGSTGQASCQTPVKELTMVKKFKKMLNQSMQSFKEGEKMIIKASETLSEKSEDLRKTMNVQTFGELQNFVFDVIEFGKTARSAIKHILDTYALVCNNGKGNQTVKISTWERFSIAIESAPFQECMENIYECEMDFLLIYKKSYQEVLPHVFTMRAGLMKCNQTCNNMLKKIDENDWGGEIEQETIKTQETPQVSLKNSREDVNSSDKPQGDAKEFSLSSGDRNEAEKSPDKTLDDSERLLLSLGDPNDSLRSLGDTTCETSANETKENSYEAAEGTNVEILRGDSTSNDSLWQQFCKVNEKTIESVKRQMIRIIVDDSPSNMIFVTLVIYLVIRAIQGIATYFNDNFLYILAAIFFYLLAATKK